MSKSTHQMQLTAVDKTAGVFSSIAGRAGKLGSLMSSAFAGIGAYMGLKAVNDGVQYLGHLSDIAMKTGTSADELTAFSNALDMLGIQRVDIDSLGKAFDYMQKTTGRTGLAGMYQTIEELAQIPDTAKRGQEAMRIFGRTGMEFMPLIAAAAQNGIGALQGVVASMPSLDDALVQSGDAVADAQTTLSKGFSYAWMSAIGIVCGAFDEQFAGGVREAAAMVANWLIYYAKVGTTGAMSAWEKMTTAVSSWGTFVGALFSGEGTIAERVAMAKQMYQDEARQREQYMEVKDAEINKKLEEYRTAYEARRAAIQQLQENSDKAAISVPVKEKQENDVKPTKAKQYRNSLIMAGSNEALKLSILGPTLDLDKKKVKLLEQININTKAKSEQATELATIEGDN